MEQMQRKRFGAIVIGAALLPSLGSAQSPGDCVVSRLSGAEARVERAAAAPEVQVGLLLQPADRVSTGAGTRMTLTCDGGEVIMTVGPDTTLLMEDVLGPDEPPTVGLLQGIAGFLFNRSDRRGFEVRTPSAVAAVRSTEWAMWVTDGATATFVREGRVQVAAGDVAPVLQAGDGVEVSAQGTMGDVTRWAPGRVAEIDTRLGPDWRAGRSQ